MFWSSMLAGLGVLGHGSVWLGIFLLVAAQFAFLVITSAIFGGGESEKQMMAGCLFTSLGAPVFQGFVMSVFVCFYPPLMLGGSGTMPSTVVLSYLWPLAKAGFIAVIALVLLCILPVLGSMIAESPGIQTFLLGVIIFRLVAGPAVAELSQKYSISSSVYPGFWSSIGYLIIAGVLARLVLFGGALISVVAKDRLRSEQAEAIVMALAPSVGVLGGILPLFMYTQHVQLALHAATGS